MTFTHDTAMALQAAAALVNTAPGAGTQGEELTTVASLEHFFEGFRYTGRLDRSRAELESVRELRTLLRRMLLGERDEVVETVNAVLAEAGAVPQLVRHEPYDWHVHAVPNDSSLATRIAVETAMAMIDVVREDDLSRLGTCADDGCEGIVVDLSRNRSKRFCSVTCGNRNAVAAYRARQSTGDDTSDDTGDDTGDTA